MESFQKPHWLVEEQASYKLEIAGKSRLSIKELLSLVVECSQKADLLLTRFGTLNALTWVDIYQLKYEFGIPLCAGKRLVAALELGRRKCIEDLPIVQVTNSQSVAKYFQVKYGDSLQERFFAMYFNCRNVIVAEKQLFVGGVCSTIVDPKVVYKTAIERLAIGIIICHNHPSGALKPSQADIDITNRLIEGGKLFDIVVKDHIIVSLKGYYSFAEHGMI